MLVYMGVIFLLLITDMVICRRYEIQPLGLVALICVGYFTACSLIRYNQFFSGLLNFKPSGFFSLFLQSTQFFWVVFLVSILRPMTLRQVKWYLKYLIILLVLTTFFESIATNLFHVPSEYFPGYRSSYAYKASPGSYQRPFGLIGSAPMNASILVILVWLYQGMKPLSRSHKIFLHSITFLTVCLNYSGQAFFAYMVAWALYVFKWDYKGTFRVFVAVCLLHLILSFGDLVHYKLSYEYVASVLRYAHFTESLRILNMEDIIFGAMSNVRELDVLTMELYPVYALSRYGIVHSLLFWTLILFPLLRTDVSKAAKVALVSALVGSLHYASIYIIFLQIPLAMYLVHGLPRYFLAPVPHLAKGEIA